MKMKKTFGVLAVVLVSAYLLWSLAYVIMLKEQLKHNSAEGKPVFHFSSDCESDWINAESSYLDVFKFILSTLISQQENYFMKTEVVGDNSGYYYVGDNDPYECMVSRSFDEGEEDETNWTVYHNGVLINMHKRGMTMSPVRNKRPNLTDEMVSDVVIMVLNGANSGKGSAKIFITSNKDGNPVLFMVDDLNKNKSLTCTEEKCRFYFSGEGTIEDPKKIRATKEKWKHDEMLKTLDTACSFVLDVKNKETLEKYKKLSGTCSGKMHPEEIIENYDDRVKECRDITEKLVPVIKEFFAI